MSQAVGSFIKIFALSMTDWTAIVTPWDCAYYMIIGNDDGSAMCRCSDDMNADTSYKMPPGGWFAYSCPAFYTKYRFKAGDTVTFLKATVPGTIATVEFYN
jgi:hypothetical protein